MLTTFDLDAYVHEALRAGASGFLLKDTLPAELLAAVRVVAAGDALLAPSITRRLIEDFVSRPIAQTADPRLDQLTAREREVLTAVAKGPLERRTRRRALHEPRHRENPRQPPPHQVRRPRPSPTRRRRLRNRPHHPRPNLTADPSRRVDFPRDNVTRDTWDMAALSSSVNSERHGSIEVITVDNPPVNVLSSHVRAGLHAGFTQAAANDATAVVLICDGRTFIAGADISEFGSSGDSSATLADVQAAMEAINKPVIAAMHGTALGGGLEVALCAHFRVALADTKLGLPEVTLGLLPGAGGTQRLPRVVGLAKALDMILSGTPIGAQEAATVGLVDHVVNGDVSALRAEALAFAAKVVAEGRPLVHIRDRSVEATGAADLLVAARSRISQKQRGFLAPQHIVTCLEAAATMPFADGLSVERKLFVELMRGPQSAAQRYYFFAERAANKIPGIAADVAQIPIASAGVLGAGTMGGGIAMNFANVGIPVTIVEREQAALDRGLSVIRSNYERSASRGSLAVQDVATRMSLITGSLSKDDFATCDIVIEAVFEDMALKQSVFRELDAICKPGAIMATNTSALNVDEIAAVTARPESVIGLHFFSPANVMKMLEVVRGRESSDSVVATSMALAKRIRKIGVLVGVCHGFVGNRMLFKRSAEAERLILEGATPGQVDRVLVEFGFPMGPFQMSDLAGLDIGWKAERSTGSTVRELLCESGRRGQKNGRGYYIYDATTRSGTPDPEVESIIRDFAVRQGREQREVSDHEVLERLLYPMVNEGARSLRRVSPCAAATSMSCGSTATAGPPTVVDRCIGPTRSAWLRSLPRSSAITLASVAPIGSCPPCFVALPSRVARFSRRNGPDSARPQLGAQAHASAARCCHPSHVTATGGRDRRARWFIVRSPGGNATTTWGC